MAQSMTRADARSFRRRWELVNRAEAEELRSTPPEVKLRQLAAFMASAEAFGWTAALAGEAEEVRRRWQRLKEAYGV